MACSQVSRVITNETFFHLHVEKVNESSHRSHHHLNVGRPPCPHPNSRDVSGVVTYAEVLLEIHGLVGGAELEERRDARGEGGVTAKQLFCTAGRDRLLDERLETVEKLRPLVGGKCKCTDIEPKLESKS